LHVVFRTNVVRYAVHVCFEKMEQYIIRARAPGDQIATCRWPEPGRCKSKFVILYSV